MPPELTSALVILVWVLIVFFVYLGIKLITGDFDRKPAAVTASKGEDNIFTKSAAAEHSKAAEANKRAQELALETAKVNQQTEQARLERVRLEART